MYSIDFYGTTTYSVGERDAKAWVRTVFESLSISDATLGTRDFVRVIAESLSIAEALAWSEWYAGISATVDEVVRLSTEVVADDLNAYSLFETVETKAANVAS